SNNQFLDINSSKFKELAENSTVKLNYKNTVLFEDKLNNILSEKGIVLLEEINIKSNEKELLNMTIDMDEEMNNDAQALENIFSIGVAYKIDETDTPIEPPTKPQPPVNPDTGIDGETDKLPQTGGIINSTSLLLLGTIVICTGIALNKKSSQGKGGKHHE
ncbi:MAG: LPXTG cell wall anchor domain-containing protein, partial [Peptostreptococcaceae bacterium]